MGDIAQIGIRDILPLAAAWGMLGFIIFPIFVILFYFLYRYVSMSSQPREAMKSIYLYLVTFIGLVFVLVGAYEIVDLVFSSYIFQVDTFVDGKAVWASSLTNLLVGGVLFFVHWQLSAKK